MPGAQVIVISTTEIFSLLTSFALVLQTKFLKKFSKKVCHNLFALLYPDYQFTKTVKQHS